jgi:NADP-dependent 3-hydroxy acid dehydrogenase YdfG
MRAAGTGTVVAISSVFGHSAVPGGGFYQASQHAAEALSDASGRRRPTSGATGTLTVLFPSSSVGQVVLRGEESPRLEGDERNPP